MKRFYSIVITVFMLFVLSFSVFAANENGIKFGQNSYCPLDGDLEGQPVTVEATVFFNKRASYGEDGILFGNTRTNSVEKSFCAFYVTKGGAPGVRWNTIDRHNDLSYTFSSVNLKKSELLHLTIVMDNEKMETRCYINGTLAEKKEISDKFEINLFDHFAVGGDSRLLNTKPFLGQIKTFAVYSDVRTEEEIKSDMTVQGTDDLILYYDFTDVPEERPVKVEDKSPSDTDLILGRLWIDEPASPVKDYDYSIVAIGDTQNMAKNYTENFASIYNWIADNIDDRKIEMVIGLGDITDQNYDYEWEAAAEVFKIIDGKVTFAPIRGNHDNLFWYKKTVTGLEYSKIVDGTYDDNYTNTYIKKVIGKVPYLFLQLDYIVTEDVLKWACGVVESNPDYNVVVSRHAHLEDWGAPIANGLESKSEIEGEELWERFLSQYENIVLMLSGHVSNDTVLTVQRKGVHGNVVTEMLIDFQSVDNTVNSIGFSRGTGMVVIFHFSDEGRKVQMETYSTVVGKYFYDVNQRTFELDLIGDGKTVDVEEKQPIVSEPKEEVNTVTEIKMTLGMRSAYVNGVRKTLDAAPVIKNSRTMLPVRFVAENLGASVGWDDATKTVSITGADVTIEIVIGATTAKVNGNVITLDSPAYIDAENNRTYLPVRAVAENLGASVAWDDATKTATLVK